MRHDRRCAGRSGVPLFADRVQRGLRGLDVGVYAAQREHLRRGAQAPRVAAVERRGAQRHPHLLLQIREVAGHERDEERGPRDRPVDPRDVRRLRTQLLGDLGPRGIGARAPHRLSPFPRRIAEPTGRVQRQSLGDVLGVAIDHPPQVTRPGEHSSDAAPWGRLARSAPAAPSRAARRSSRRLIEPGSSAGRHRVTPPGRLLLECRFDPRQSVE